MAAARLRRVGTRPTQEMERAAEDLRRRRDVAAEELGLDPSFIAPTSDDGIDRGGRGAERDVARAVAARSAPGLIAALACGGEAGR